MRGNLELEEERKQRFAAVVVSRVFGSCCVHGAPQKAQEELSPVSPQTGSGAQFEGKSALRGLEDFTCEAEVQSEGFESGVPSVPLAVTHKEREFSCPTGEREEGHFG